MRFPHKLSVCGILSKKGRIGGITIALALLLPLSADLLKSGAETEYPPFSFVNEQGNAMACNTWLGVLRPASSWARLALWMAIGLGGLGFFSLCTVGLIASLRHKVRVRTQGLEKANHLLQRTQHAIDHLADPLYWVARDGSFLYANFATATLLGYEVGELKKKKIWDIADPMTAPSWEKLWQDVSQQGALSFEGGALHRNGERIPMDIHASFFAVDGESCIVALAHDIRRRKAHEEERHRLEEQLAHSRKLESVGQLAGGIAHDFNNLLTGIMGHTEYCKLSLPDDHPLQGPLEDILRSVQRSADITRKLLGFARKQTAQPRVIDFNQAIHDSLSLLHRLIGENIRLKFEAAEDLPSIRMDPGQITQILTNLCVNSRDAIDSTGEITLSTWSEPSTIPGDPPRVYLKVCDTGKGMSEHTRANAFEPFYSTKPVGHGIGLGLPNVYGIVMQNKGGIDLESTPGQGACVTLWIPGVVEESSPETKTETPSAPEKLSVLVVDDEPFICESIRYGLKDLGYQVNTATEAKKAIELARTVSPPYDILITDVIMPDQNGKELSEQLTREFPDLKTLFISGFPADVVARQGIVDPDVRLLSKPFGRDQLARELQDLIG